MHRHMRQRCKIANSDEGMAKLMDKTLQGQMEKLQAQNAVLQQQVSELSSLVRHQLTLTGAGGTPGAATTINNLWAAPQTTNIGIVQNVQFNIVGFDRDDRIYIPVALVKAAFTENPRLVEYCRMSDDERVDAERAAPYVLEALVDLIRRAHRDPVYRNIYLDPRRADQVMVCLDEEGPGQKDAKKWEVRSLVEAIRLLFDGVADNLHKILITDRERAQLPFDVQSAASWVPNLYEDEPERFVKDGKAPMAAHLANTRPGLSALK
jgi:hypothetical protein